TGGSAGTRPACGPARPAPVRSESPRRPRPRPARAPRTGAAPRPPASPTRLPLPAAQNRREAKEERARPESRATTGPNPNPTRFAMSPARATHGPCASDRVVPASRDGSALETGRSRRLRTGNSAPPCARRRAAARRRTRGTQRRPRVTAPRPSAVAESSPRGAAPSGARRRHRLRSSDHCPPDRPPVREPDAAANRVFAEDPLEGRARVLPARPIARLPPEGEAVVEVARGVEPLAHVVDPNGVELEPGGSEPFAYGVEQRRVERLGRH